MRVQLSMVLQAVVSQQLIPTLDGGLVPAFEIMIVNNAIRNLIRENKIYQINNVIFSSGSAHMVTMDSSIFSLYQQKAHLRRTCPAVQHGHRGHAQKNRTVDRNPAHDRRLQTMRLSRL